MRSTLPRLAVIAAAAGAFSGLFGVGGGTIIVPLLILWLAYGEREATGTSLVAIIAIAALAAGVHGLYGNVDPAAAALVAGPGIAGILAGTALQQRVAPWALSGVFALLLVISAGFLIA